MRTIIRKSKVDGVVDIPPSKSYTHRALICSGLAKGKSRIINPLDCDDTNATLECLRKIGVKIEKKKKFWEVEGGGLQTPKKELFCRQSGTTMRFMAAICSLVDGKSKLTGDQSLLRRPIKPLVEGLNQLGVNAYCDGNFPPVIIEGNLKGGKTKIPGNVSSQFVSAILLVSPLAEDNVNIGLTTELESKPYVRMTMETQRDFGVKVKFSDDLTNFSITPQKYKSTNYNVEGDWSSAAFLLVVGVIAGRVEVKNLNLESLQADRRILNILEKMGAKVTRKKDSVIVEKSKIKPIEVDLSDSPDLFPIVCILCSLANGESRISGIERLRIKESDRIAAMKEGLIKMGIRFKENRDNVMIRGSKPIGTIVDPRNDHRIAMAFGVLGLVTEGEIVVKNSECVSKSFPEFWSIIKNIGGNIKIR